MHAIGRLDIVEKLTLYHALREPLKGLKCHRNGAGLTRVRERARRGSFSISNSNCICVFEEVTGPSQETRERDYGYRAIISLDQNSCPEVRCGIRKECELGVLDDRGF